MTYSSPKHVATSTALINEKVVLEYKLSVSKDIRKNDMNNSQKPLFSRSLAMHALKIIYRVLVLAENIDRHLLSTRLYPYSSRCHPTVHTRGRGAAISSKWQPLDKIIILYKKTSWTLGLNSNSSAQREWQFLANIITKLSHYTCQLFLGEVGDCQVLYTYST